MGKSHSGQGYFSVSALVNIITESVWSADNKVNVFSTTVKLILQVAGKTQGTVFFAFFIQKNKCI